MRAAPMTTSQAAPSRHAGESAASSLEACATPALRSLSINAQLRAGQVSHNPKHLLTAKRRPRTSAKGDIATLGRTWHASPDGHSNCSTCGQVKLLHLVTGV